MSTHHRAKKKNLISFCIPVLNEQDNILPAYERIKKVMAGEAEHYDYEIVFTDNHSNDRTFEILAELAESDPKIRVLRFSRNYGFQQSILTNYLHCQGDAAIQLDCDLQDPPEMIPEFLRKWEEGYKVIYGIRKSRVHESWILTASRKLFYRVIDFLSEHHLPHDAGDFRLIDRVIINQLVSIGRQQPYLRGAIASFGFKQTGLPYHRNSRQYGISKFNFSKLFGLALDGILSHSLVPLRIAIFVGLVVSVLASPGLRCGQSHGL